MEIIPARTPTTITIEWENGAADGGAQVEDYRVTYDQANDDYVILESAINAQTFTATGLTSGLIYKFKVESRNSYGYSEYSDVVSILSAAEPDQP